MNLGISRKKYDPCKMETILFHKEEWPRGRWTNRIDGHRGYTKIEFPLTYHTPYIWPTFWPIYIYIYFTRSRRGYDEFYRVVWGDISFFFSQVKPRGVRSKRNCELSGPRRESWMKCLTYRWMGRPECLSGVQWTYLKQRKEYWLISAVSWAVYHATKDNTWYHFKT